MQVDNAAVSPAGSVYTGSVKRAVFLVCPHAGGTFSVYLTLRAALARFGIILDWLGLSSNPDEIRQNPQYVSELQRGHLMDIRNKTDPELCRQLVSKIGASGYDVAFINVLTSPTEMSVAAYLPPHIRRIMVIHSISPGTYAAAKAVAPYVDIAVGVSPRIVRDLKGRMPIVCVPNAIDLSPYENLQRTRAGESLRLLYLGRISDADKGVFWLPKILAQLADVSVHLTIAGAGDDFDELKRRCAPVAQRITFLGRVAYADIPALLSRHDVLLMPSRFEGFGYTLIEAMAAGCVPVASKISGVTDFIVSPEENGLLFPIGNTTAAAQSICRLNLDRALLAQCSAAAPAAVRGKFSMETLAEGYLRVLERLGQTPEVATSRAGAPCELLSFAGSWRRFIPRPIKNYLRAQLLR